MQNKTKQRKTKTKNDGACMLCVLDCRVYLVLIMGVWMEVLVDGVFGCGERRMVLIESNLKIDKQIFDRELNHTQPGPF